MLSILPGKPSPYRQLYNTAGYLYMLTLLTICTLLDSFLKSSALMSFVVHLHRHAVLPWCGLSGVPITCACCMTVVWSIRGPHYLCMLYDCGVVETGYLCMLYDCGVVETEFPGHWLHHVRVAHGDHGEAVAKHLQLLDGSQKVVTAGREESEDMSVVLKHNI